MNLRITTALLAAFILLTPFLSPRAEEGTQMSYDQTLTYICDKINGFGEQPNMIMGKQSYKAKRTNNVIEIEESYSNPWQPSKFNKIVRTVDFAQFDPTQVSANGKNFSATTVEKRKAIKEVTTDTDGKTSEKSASLLHLVCSDDTAARRLANAFKHAIAMSHGPGSKPDPFDK